jgi:hypothetical protein
MVEVDVVGQVVDLDPLERGLRREAPRTGSRNGLSRQICAWQFMQVFVGGTFATAARSTPVWQYRQSIPSSPA